MASVVQWVLSHQVVLAVALVGLMDLAMALNPKLDANGMFHQVYLWLKALLAPKQP